MSYSEQLILEYSITDEERNAILKAQESLVHADVTKHCFSHANQFKAFNTLNDDEMAATLVFWQCMEAKKYSLAWSIISKLYTSEKLKNESKGSLALCCEFACTIDTPMSSIIQMATPITRVDYDDWAFFLAIARLKLDHNLILQAGAWIELAERVPFHHRAMVAATRFELFKQLDRAQHYGTRVIPRLLTDYDTVLSGFKDGDELRPILQPIIAELKSNPTIENHLRLRESSMPFQRLTSRAENLYYRQNWQLLPNAEPQPASIWGTVPDTVVKVMACVADWSPYLKLASTCKLLHNRFNHPRVWLHVLDTKWNLDISVFNEDTPNNPVELVQQIHLLTMLNRNHFECDYIHCPPPSNLLQASIMNLRLSNILNRRMVIVSAAEMAVSTFSAVVAADRTGDLTRRLIEDSCMIEFLINIIRSSPETRNELVKASVMSLATLYVRSRTTCALVSRLLPPPLVSLLYHDQPISSVRALNACAYASYVLYPGAHAQPCPKHPDSAEPSISNAEAKDAMVARHTDLNPVMIFPQHSSEYYLIEEVTDGWSRSEPAQELPIEKETYNLNFVPYGTHSDPIGETFALALSHGNEEEHELEELLSEALVQNFKILERFETVAEEEENERDEIEEKQQEEALERGEVLEIDKHAGIGDDPFSPIALRAKAVKWAERFATADNEWHLYLSLTNSSCSTVLHRAVLKLSIDVPDDEKSEYSEVEANGYWTMAHDESLSTVVESGSAGFGPGAYGSPEDAAGSSKLFTPEWWCETHAISLTGRLDLSFGSFRAKIARESPLVANEKSAPPKRGKRKEPKKEERWQLSGQSFEYGFRGDILVVSSDNERGVVGGFLLLKADATNEMEEFGIRAYQQLAPLSVKQGPLADTPLLPIGPRDLRRDIGYEQIALTSSILVAAYSNYHAMDSLHIDGLILANRSSPFMQSFFFNDPVNEEILGPWQTLRLDFARLTSQDLEGVRGALISGFKEELSHDLEFYHSFGLPTILRLKQISNLLNPYYDLADLDFCNVQHWDVSEENWDKALLIYYKWAYRLSMFELLGSPIEKAVIFLWNYLYKNTSQLA